MDITFRAPTFSDVEGFDAIKKALEPIVKFLKASRPASKPSLIEALARMVRVILPSIETEPILDSTDQFSSIEVPHCLLICGPHTSEKKSLMRALAGEANVPGFCISGRELNDVPVIGWTDEVVSELLAQAKKAAPCIIFVDNIDDGLDESARRRLIKLMDGVRVKGSKVILVANTSIPGALDLTLTRRFDCCIKF